MIETTMPYSSNDIRRGILVRGWGRGRRYGQGIHNKVTIIKHPRTLEEKNSKDSSLIIS